MLVAKHVKSILGGILLYSSCLMSFVQADEQRLVIADARGDWGQLAPYLHMARGPGYVYTSFLFDTLVWKDGEGELKPLLAKQWTSDEDQRCHHFSLDDRAQWHDGEQVSAEDVIFTLGYAQKHQYRFVDVSGIDTVSSSGNKVSICLHKPDAQFVAQVAGSLPILPLHVYAKVDDPLRFTASEALTGSGPYRLTDYNRAQGFYHLSRHDNWHLGKPRYKSVIINRLSPHGAAAAMRKGEVDVMSIPQEFVDLFRNTGAEILETASNHPYRLLFNHSDRFVDKTVRHGLARAIDRIQLVELAFHGNALPARPAYRQEGNLDGFDLYSFDPEAATKQLQTAGWKQLQGGRWADASGQPVQLRLIASPTSERLAKVLARQLTDFGFQLSIALLQDVPLTKALQQKHFDLALLSQSHQGNPDRFRTLLSSHQGNGDQYHMNTELIQLLEQMRHQPHPEQRESMMIQAERLYNADLPSLPLVNPINFAAQRPGSGAAFTPGGIAMGVPLPLNKLSLFRPDRALGLMDTP